MTTLTRESALGDVDALGRTIPFVDLRRGVSPCPTITSGTPRTPRMLRNLFRRLPSHDRRSGPGNARAGEKSKSHFH